MTPFVLYILCHNLIFFKPIRIPSEPWDKCPPSFLALLLRIRKQMDSGYKRWFCLSFSGWPWAGDSPGVIFYQAGLAIKFWNQSPLDCFISLKPYVSVRVLQKKQNYVSIICPSIHPPIYLAIHLSICVYRHTYIYSLKVIGKARNSGRNWCYSLTSEFLLLQETLLLTYKAFNCLDKAHHVIKGNLLYSKWTDCRG